MSITMELKFSWLINGDDGDTALLYLGEYKHYLYSFLKRKTGPVKDCKITNMAAKAMANAFFLDMLCSGFCTGMYI